MTLLEQLFFYVFGALVGALATWLWVKRKDARLAYPVVAAGSHLLDEKVIVEGPKFANLHFCAMTGVDVEAVRWARNKAPEHLFDDAEVADIHLIEFAWSEHGKNLVHRVIYRDGVLYHAYLTMRGGESIYYPPIRVPLQKKKMRAFMELATPDEDVDVALFNRMCAPRAALLATGTSLKCTMHLRAAASARPCELQPPVRASS